MKVNVCIAYTTHTNIYIIICMLYLLSGDFYQQQQNEQMKIEKRSSMNK